MSVLKSKRKESDFEVIAHFYETRRKVTDLLLRDFGYSASKSEKHLSKMFGGVPYEDLTEEQKQHYDRRKERNKSFEDWFILSSRECILECIRDIQTNIFLANSLYPEYMEELIQRRMYQDEAIGHCYRLTQELQYIIETLPVDINKLIPFVDDINREIALLKSWRKADNKHKKRLENK